VRLAGTSWSAGTFQEFGRITPVMHAQFFAAVLLLFDQLETLIGFTTGGSLVVYYAQDDIYRSSRHAHLVTMTNWVTEYWEMACNLWCEEARDCGF